MLGAPRESDAYLKAKKIFDSSGLFLPTPVFAGLSPEEQRSIERMHVECLKKLPSISLQTFVGEDSEDLPELGGVRGDGRVPVHKCCFNLDEP